MSVTTRDSVTLHGCPGRSKSLNGQDHINAFFLLSGNSCSVPVADTLQYYITSYLSGDIMKKLAPFLKLYTEYVKNFDNAMNIIIAVEGKYPRFKAIMDDIHVSQCLCLVFFFFVIGARSIWLGCTAAYKAYCATLIPHSPWFRRSHFPHQAPPRP